MNIKAILYLSFSHSAKLCKLKITDFENFNFVEDCNEH